MTKDKPVISKTELIEKVIFPGESVEYRFNKFDIHSEFRGKVNMTDMKPIAETVYLADVKRDTERKLAIIPFLTDSIAWGNFTSRTQTLGLSILADFFGENYTRNWFESWILDPIKYSLFNKNPYPGSEFWLTMHSAGWTLAAIFYQEFTTRLLSSERSDRFTITGRQIMKFLNNYGIGLIPSDPKNKHARRIYVIKDSKAASLVEAYKSPYPIGDQSFKSFYNKELGEPYKEQ